MLGTAAKIKYMAPYHLHVCLARKFITIVMNLYKAKFIGFIGRFAADITDSRSLVFASDPRGCRFQ